MESLYRKYRPLTFESVVGQQHIVSTLEHAVTEGRLSHAYLFCGPRGTGKTTMARILAKSLLCEGADAARAKGAAGCLPDGTCAECQAIAEGAHPDVYELDAASRTGVDNVREEIIGSVNFAPVRGAYKIYIIDEVHMLTTAAFNALLKTLEEPPSHVVFVLCTTDPQKIPETILSRCQRFDFHRIGNEDIVGRLRYICEQEGFSFDDDALETVAKHARGGMRDALSTLEQLSVFGNGSVRAADARALLGEVSGTVLSRFSHAIASRDVSTLFSLVKEQVEAGEDLMELTRDLVAHVRDVYMVHVAGARPELIDGTPDEIAALAEEAALFESGDRISRVLVVLDDAALEMRSAADMRLVLEIALTRLARPESDLTLEALAERLDRLERQVAKGIPSVPLGAADVAALVNAKPAAAAAAVAAAAPVAAAAAAPAAAVEPAPAAAATAVEPAPTASPAEPAAPAPAASVAAPVAAATAPVQAATPSVVSTQTAPVASAAPASAKASAESHAPITTPTQAAQASTSNEWASVATPLAPEAAAVSTSPAASAASAAPSPSASSASPASSTPAPAAAPAVRDLGELQRKWDEVVRHVTAVQPSRGSLLLSSRAIEDDGTTLTVNFPAGSGFAITMLGRPDTQNIGQPQVADVIGPLAIKYVMGQASGAAPQPAATHSAPAPATPAAQPVAQSAPAPASVPQSAAPATQPASAAQPASAPQPAAPANQPAPASAPQPSAPANQSTAPAAQPAAAPVSQPVPSASQGAPLDGQVPYEDDFIPSYVDEDLPPFDMPASEEVFPAMSQASGSTGNAAPAPSSAKPPFLAAAPAAPVNKMPQATAPIAAPAPAPAAPPAAPAPAPAASAAFSAAPVPASSMSQVAVPTAEPPAPAAPAGNSTGAAQAADDDIKDILGSIFGDGVVFTTMDS